MTKMLGAVCGDILGSSYEHNNIKHIPTLNEILKRPLYFTDDSILTAAVAKGLSKGLMYIPNFDISHPGAEDILVEHVEKALVELGLFYSRAGYGGMFRQWLGDENRKPYNSFGNGSAMRASYAGWIAKSLDEAVFFAKCSAEVTHNHPEGIKGAVVIAQMIYLLRQGKTKDEVREFASKYYDIDFTLDSIRDTYTFDVTCQGSVPHAIVAFLEGNSYEEIICLAISIGGDSDTIAAISGSLAEVIYPISDTILNVAEMILDDTMKFELSRAVMIADSVNEAK